MTEYKILGRKMFSKEASFLEKMNTEAKSGWKVISIGYNMEGHITKAVLEKIKNH